jgi:eukaryotic-like serine/threonine-protein kinase
MGVTLETGSTFAGKYRIDGVLGRGGMGSVFAATNLSVGRRVAIKVMDTSNVDEGQRAGLLHRFKLEAQAASLIDHPGIADVIDMGETQDGAPYMVMEFLEGATLKAVQKVLGPLTLGQTMAVLDPVLDALAAAHAAKVIHRDIKPANIFLTTRPRQAVKVLDFGISRFGAGTGLTQTGTAMGTPQYMSPEQVRGEKGGGPEADLYSVGALIYALLNGKPPFDSDSDMAVLARVLTDKHVPLIDVANVPPALSRLVDRLLTKDRNARPSSASELRQTLLTFATPDPEPLFQAALLAVKGELARGTPRPNTGSSSRPGVLAMPRTPSRTTSAAVQRPKEPEPTPEHELVKTPSDTLLPEEAAVVPSRSRGMVFGLGLVVVALVSVGAVALFREPPSPPPVVVAKKTVAVEPPAVPAKTTPEPPSDAPKLAEVAVTLSAEPANTRFVVDGAPRDCNPCTLTQKPGTTVAVKALAEHFVTKEFDVAFDHPREQHLVLAPDPADVKKNPTRKTKTLTVDEANPYR